MSHPPATFTQEPGLQEITPTYGELVIDISTSSDGPTPPWSLVKVDRDLNRIYLAASSSDCVTPTKVRIEQRSTSITLSVVGVGGTGPCTLEKKTMIGYVQPKSPIGNRTILGDTPNAP